MLNVQPGQIGQNLQYVVSANTIDTLGLSETHKAMVYLWYGNRQQIAEAAQIVAQAVRAMPDCPKAPEQWITDAVLYATGHRQMMQSIPKLAAEMVVRINNSTEAITVLWAVGEIVRDRIGRPAWIAARRALQM